MSAVIPYQVVGRDPTKLRNFTDSDLDDLKGAIRLESQLESPLDMLKLSAGKPGEGKHNLYGLDDGLEDENCVFDFRTLCSKYKISLHNPILVELPAPPDALSPTDQPGHPSSDRRKRFRDLNDIIAQKAKKAKKSEDATSASYSTMSWTDIKPVYAPLIKDVKIAPMGILEEDLDCLYNHLSVVSRAIGGVLGSKEAKRMFFIGAILFYLVEILDKLGDKGPRISILIEESVNGKSINIEGRFEFVITRGLKKICIVEAKKEDMDQGMAQDLLGCEAVADLESAHCVYGIVTNYQMWIFIQNLDDRIERDDATLQINDHHSIPTKEGLQMILGKICTLLFDPGP